MPGEHFNAVAGGAPIGPQSHRATLIKAGAIACNH